MRSIRISFCRQCWSIHPSIDFFYTLWLKHSFLEQVTESDAVDIAETAIKRHTSDLTTKAMALIALLKLSSRFPSCSEYVDIFFLLTFPQTFRQFFFFFSIFLVQLEFRALVTCVSIF